MEKKFTIRKALSEEDINTIARIAEFVMHETFDALTPAGQSDYMIRKFLTPQVIADNIKNHGYTYKIFDLSGEPQGFIAYCPASEYDKSRAEGTFMSKLYLMPCARGIGIPDAVLPTLKRPVILTVKRDNERAVRAYKRNGFEIIGDISADIGGGYKMVDYLMELK